MPSVHGLSFLEQGILVSYLLDCGGRGEAFVSCLLNRGVEELDILDFFFVIEDLGRKVLIGNGSGPGVMALGVWSVMTMAFYLSPVL